MGSKACIYENASTLGKVDGAALIKLYELELDRDLTESQAFASAMTIMTQQTESSLEQLRQELNLEHDVQINIPTSKIVAEAAKYTEGATLANTILAGGLGMSGVKATIQYIKRTINDYVKVNPNATTNLLTSNTNFFRGFLNGVRVKELKDITSLQEAGIKRIAEFATTFHARATELNSFIQAKTLFLPNLEGKIDPADPSKNIIGDLSGYFVQEDADGNKTLNENFTGAMTLAVLNWFKSGAEDTLYNDPDSLRAILALDDDAPIPDGAVELLALVGDTRAGIADRIGADMFSNLGLTETGADGFATAKIKSDLGMTAVGILIDMGILEDHAISSAEIAAIKTGTTPDKDNKAITHFVRVSTKGTSNENRMKISQVAQEIKDTVKHDNGALKILSDSSSRSKEVSFEPIKTVNKAIKGTLQTISKIQEKALKRYQNVPQKLFTKNTKMFQFIGTDLWKEHYGYIDNVDTLHVTKRTGALGLNRSIERDLLLADEHIELALDEEGKAKPFYYHWKAIKNLRMHTDSSGFNTQQSKVHRWLGGAASWDISVDKNDTETMNLFKVAIAQAFNVDIDKISLEDSLHQFEGIFNTEVIQDALVSIDAVNSDLDMDPDLKAEHQATIMEAVRFGKNDMHSMAGLVALHDYVSSFGSDAAFNTTISIEYDGLTNGVIIGLLQSAMDEDIESLLESGAIFTDNKTTFFGDWYNGTINIDSYERLALAWNANIDSMQLPSAIRIYYMKLFTQLVDQDGNVTTMGRKLSKHPLMTSNYGRAVTNIQKAFKEEAVESFYTELMDTKDQTEAEQLIKTTGVVNDLTVEYKIAELKQSISELSAEDQKSTNENGAKAKLERQIKFWSFQTTSGFAKIPKITWADRANYQLPDATLNVIREGADIAMGRGLAQALNGQLTGLNKYSETINRSFQVMFEAFNLVHTKLTKEAEEKKYVLSLTEAPAKRVKRSKISLSKKEKEEIYAQAIGFLPAIKTPISDSNENKLVIMKTERRRDHDSPEKKTGVKFARKINNVNQNPETHSSFQSMQTTPEETVNIDPGVSGGPLTTQMMDASNMVYQIVSNHVLNVHDAIIGSIKEMTKHGTQYNDDFIELNIGDYSIMEEVETSVIAVLKKLKKDYPELHNDLMVKDDYSFIPEGGILPVTSVAHAISLLAEVAPQVAEGRAKLKEHGNITVNQLVGSGTAATRTNDQGLKDTKLEDLIESELDAIINKAGDDMMRPLGSDGASFDFESFQSAYEVNLTSQNTLNTFDNLQSSFDGDVKDSHEQVEHLRGVIGGIVNKVISEADAAPVSLRINKEGTEVLGQITDGIIQIQAGRSNSVENTSQLSTQEVFVHEMVHHITDFALQTDFVYRTQIEKLRAQVKKVLTVEDFMPEHTAVSKEADYAAAKKRYDYIFSGKDSLQEFVAFGMTNAQIRKKLAAIPATPTRDLTSGSLWDRFKALWNSILDFAQGKFYGTKDVMADKALDLLVQKLVDTNSRYHESIRSKLGIIGQLDRKTIDALNEYVWAPVTKFHLSGKGQKASTWAGKQVKSLAGIPFVLKSSMGRANLINSLKQVLTALRVTERGFMIKLAREIQGITADNSQWHQLLRLSKMYVDQERRQVAELITKAVADSFIAGKPTDAEADSITQSLLKTDVSSLQGKYDLSQLSKLLSNPSYRNAEMSKLETQLKAFNASQVDGNGNYYIRQALNLGEIMAKGEGVEDNPMLNAFNIVRMKNLTRTATGDLKLAEDLVDHLATLSAIQHTEQEINVRAAKVVDREYKGDPKANGIQFTLETHANFKDESLKKLFFKAPYVDGNRAQVQKGYTAEITNPNIELRMGEDNEKTMLEMKALGFKRDSGLAKDDKDNNRTPMALYITKSAAQNTYLKTMVSLTNKIAKGTDIMQSFRASGTKTSNKDRIAAMAHLKVQKASSVDEQFKSPKRKTKKKNHNILVPVVDENGNITSYRYMMNEATKVNTLEKKNKFDLILGRMQASIHDKVKSADVNKEVLTLAHKEFQDAKTLKGFVKIGPKVTDPRYREIYAMMPKDMKRDMIDIWGKDTIQIKEELVDLIFGYRKLSITDMNIPFSEINVFDEIENIIPGARQTAKIIERGVQELVSAAKDNIVIKSGVVLWDNVASNNVVLMIKGVNPKYIARDSALAYTALGKYQEEVRKRATLQHKLDVSKGLSAIARKNLTKQIESYTDSIQANPVRELIEEGIFQSIVEDVEINASDYSYRSQAGDFIQAFTGKITDGKKTASTAVEGATEVYKQAYMTKDTLVYQQLLHFTQKSDFVARFVLYQHHMRKLDKQVAKKGLKGKEKEAFTIQAKQKALLDVIETFVNYDIPTSPAVQYLNDIGVLMFTKFLFRIQKVIVRMFRENPANTMALYALEHTIGDLASIDDSFLPFTDLMSKFNMPITGVFSSAAQVSGVEFAEQFIPI